MNVSRPTLTRIYNKALKSIAKAFIEGKIMPLNHKGPEGIGPKMGRKLGNCTPSKDELNQIGKPGIGRGLRRHSQNPGGAGLGKRFRYDQTITENKE